MPPSCNTLLLPHANFLSLKKFQFILSNYQWINGWRACIEYWSWICIWESCIGMNHPGGFKRTKHTSILPCIFPGLFSTWFETENYIGFLCDLTGCWNEWLSTDLIVGSLWTSRSGVSKPCTVARCSPWWAPAMTLLSGPWANLAIYSNRFLYVNFCKFVQI